jgi:predicted membrane-bound spermidine synthase
VRVINDDARSFFSRTHEKYDVISFGLRDSHTTTALTNARLDHYVYTKESVARAKQLLADGGVMVLSFEATRPFIAQIAWLPLGGKNFKSNRSYSEFPARAMAGVVSC